MPLPRVSAQVLHGPQVQAGGALGDEGGRGSDAPAAAATWAGMLCCPTWASAALGEGQVPRETVLTAWTPEGTGTPRGPQGPPGESLSGGETAASPSSPGP